MHGAQHAVHEAAVKIPAEIRERFDTADKLGMRIAKPSLRLPGRPSPLLFPTPILPNKPNQPIPKLKSEE